MSWSIASLLVLLVCAALWTVLTPALLHSAIGLAATSIVLSVILYRFDSPFAAVFELSVCAGLITVVFVSTISLTRTATVEEERLRAATRIRRFIWCPIVLAIVAAFWLWLNPALPLPSLPAQSGGPGVREMLWNYRRFDIVGQLLLILGGVFGVVLLFRGWESDKEQGDD